MKKLAVFLLVAVLVVQSGAQVHAADDLWALRRPPQTMYILEKADNMTTTNESSVGLGVGITQYDELPGDIGYFMMLNVSATANSRKPISYTKVGPNTNWLYGLSWVYPADLAQSSINQTLENLTGNFVFPVDISFISFKFRFYGGAGSAEYTTIYISSNGFIGFDNTTQPCPTPSLDQSLNNSNAMIAACWTDLNITGLNNGDS